MNFKYFMDIKEGDVVIASKGKKKIMGIGVVTGSYKFIKTDEVKHRHSIPVDWYYTKEKDIPTQGDWRKTVGPVTYEKFCSLIIGSGIITQENIVIPTEIQELILKFDSNRKVLGLFSIISYQKINVINCRNLSSACLHIRFDLCEEPQSVVSATK